MNSLPELNDFQFLDILGEGSFSKVKLVKRISDNKLLALKQVNLDKLETKQINQALNQVRLLASIHSNYVISYEGSFYSSQTNILCILMQYADEGDLQVIILVNQGDYKQNSQEKQNGKRAFLGFHLESININFQGLKILHDNNIVHRDIKSANIFFCHGIAKLGDLNVSSIADSSFYSTNTGTPYYTAPQIWKGQKYTKNCDIWSFGCIIYEMCTLLPPFRADSIPQLYLKVIKGEYPPLPQYLSEDLKIFIKFCLQVDNNQRPTITQLFNNSIIKNKLAQYEIDINFNGKVDLIKPLKCPKKLAFINYMLPKTYQNKQNSKSGSFKDILIKKQDIKIQNKNHKININHDQLIFRPAKSTIRIKSCKKIKLIREPKSVQIIQSFHNENNQNYINEVTNSQNFQLKTKSQIKQQRKVEKFCKNQKFRVRSYKKIIQKENVNQN